jgi:DNA-binding XRE family transcriptional regulator
MRLMKLSNVEVPGLGARCREARIRYCQRTGLTADQVAEKIGPFNRSHLYAIENDKSGKAIKLKHLIKMQDTYGEDLKIPPGLECSDEED